MSEKRFIEDFSYLINYPKHHCVFDGMQQKNLELDETIGLLNIFHQENQELAEENEKLEQKIKDKNTYQRVLEAKIRRLKNRIKILEKAEGWQN